MAVIDALREYFLGCPLLAGGRINADWLPEDEADGAAYSLNTTPGKPLVRSFIDGGGVYQHLFTLSTVRDYGPEIFQNLLNSGFFEGLAGWIRERQRARELPRLPDGMKARKLEALTSGYPITVTPTTAYYQIQLRLEYQQKGDR